MNEPSTFSVVSVHGPALRVTAQKVAAVAHSQWVRMFLGRALAPATLIGSAEEVRYLVSGTPLERVGDELFRRAAVEAATADVAELKGVVDHHVGLIERVSRGDAPASMHPEFFLVSYQVLAEVTVSDDPEDWIITDEGLRIVRWGLSGPRFRPLLQWTPAQLDAHFRSVLAKRQAEPAPPGARQRARDLDLEQARKDVVDDIKSRDQQQGLPSSAAGAPGNSRSRPTPKSPAGAHSAGRGGGPAVARGWMFGAIGAFAAFLAASALALVLAVGSREATGRLKDSDRSADRGDKALRKISDRLGLKFDGLIGDPEVDKILGKLDSLSTSAEADSSLAAGSRQILVALSQAHGLKGLGDADIRSGLAAGSRGAELVAHAKDDHERRKDFDAALRQIAEKVGATAADRAIDLDPTALTGIKDGVGESVQNASRFRAVGDSARAVLQGVAKAIDGGAVTDGDLLAGADGPRAKALRATAEAAAGLRAQLDRLARELRDCKEAQAQPKPSVPPPDGAKQPPANGSKPVAGTTDAPAPRPESCEQAWREAQASGAALDASTGLRDAKAMDAVREATDAAARTGKQLQVAVLNERREAKRLDPFPSNPGLPCAASIDSVDRALSACFARRASDQNWWDLRAVGFRSDRGEDALCFSTLGVIASPGKWVIQCWASRAGKDGSEGGPAQPDNPLGNHPLTVTVKPDVHASVATLAEGFLAKSRGATVSSPDACAEVQALSVVIGLCDECLQRRLPVVILFALLYDLERELSGSARAAVGEGFLTSLQGWVRPRIDRRLPNQPPVGEIREDGTVNLVWVQPNGTLGRFNDLRMESVRQVRNEADSRLRRLTAPRSADPSPWPAGARPLCVWASGQTAPRVPRDGSAYDLFVPQSPESPSYSFRRIGFSDAAGAVTITDPQRPARGGCVVVGVPRN